MKPFYITTPIYYPSDKLHIGHSYTTVAADAMARYKRMQGYDVMFLTGTDEHGQKIEDKAKAAGCTPKEYVDNIVKGIKELWKLMNISHDRFIRTTDDYHELSVQRIFKKLYDKGDIYKSVYKGMYCKPCEAFWTQSQLVDGKCPDCGAEVQEAEEEAYFFKQSSYAARLEQYYADHPDFLQPKSRLNEMLNNFIRPGLEDLCVSRTSFTWGVPVSFDEKHVVYVWIDALSNYITALGYENDAHDDYDKYWPADVHLMAKEIVRFHSITWPCLLMALDLPLPKKVFGHGWLLLDGGKMSKSKGNVVDPVILCERYGVDAIRYFLLREIPFGQDGYFSNEALIHRINSDLANDLGNLVSRTIAMIEKYFGSTLPDYEPVISEELDTPLIEQAASLAVSVEAQYDNMQFPNALTDIFKLVSRSNKYIDETMPWVLGKDEAQKPRLATVLYNLCECIRIVSILLSPVMPTCVPQIQRQVGAGKNHTRWEDAGIFGLLPRNLTVTKGDALFPRIDIKKELADLGAQRAASAPAPKAEAKKNAPATPQQITIDDFAKVELRVAKVTACEPVPKSDKLLCLQLDDGAGGRQVVSGIAQWYAPVDLIGRNVVLVANLKPAKLRGVKSEGMILAVDHTDGSANVIFPGDDLAPGSKVR